MRNQSVLLQNAYGSADMRRIFHERNMVQKWMDFESAISQVQAELGLIPKKLPMRSPANPLWSI